MVTQAFAGRRRHGSSASATRRPNCSRRSRTRSICRPLNATFDYFGLNHLGWLREVYSAGARSCRRLWDDPERCARSTARRCSSRISCASCGCCRPSTSITTIGPRDAFENVRRAGRAAASVIQQLNARAVRRSRAAGRRSVGVYEQYLTARNAGYMQIESGAARPDDTVALGRARPATTGSRSRRARDPLQHERDHPAERRQPRQHPELEDDDVVEVPCVVNTNGAQPLHVGPVPDAGPRPRRPGQGLRAPDGSTQRCPASAEPPNARSRAIRWFLIRPLPTRLVHALLDA